MPCAVIVEIVMQMQMNIKTYSELITIPTYEERFEYLRCNSAVGKETFGFDRYLNQVLYNSMDWKRLRRQIIIRDNGCDLALEGYTIYGKIIIHHINPISLDDIMKERSIVFDPENLVCVSFNTHNAIHYGDASLLSTGPIERTPNDTCPWR